MGRKTDRKEGQNERAGIGMHPERSGRSADEEVSFFFCGRRSRCIGGIFNLWALMGHTALTLVEVVGRKRVGVKRHPTFDGCYVVERDKTYIVVATTPAVWAGERSKPSPSNIAVAARPSTLNDNESRRRMVAPKPTAVQTAVEDVQKAPPKQHQAVAAKPKAVAPTPKAAIKGAAVPHRLPPNADVRSLVTPSSSDLRPTVPTLEKALVEQSTPSAHADGSLPATFVKHSVSEDEDDVPITLLHRGGAGGRRSTTSNNRGAQQQDDAAGRAATELRRSTAVHSVSAAPMRSPSALADHDAAVQSTPNSAVRLLGRKKHNKTFTFAPQEEDSVTGGGDLRGASPSNAAAFPREESSAAAVSHVIARGATSLSLPATRRAEASPSPAPALQQPILLDSQMLRPPPSRPDSRPQEPRSGAPSAIRDTTTTAQAIDEREHSAVGSPKREKKEKHSKKEKKDKDKKEKREKKRHRSEAKSPSSKPAVGAQNTTTDSLAAAVDDDDHTDDEKLRAAVGEMLGQGSKQQKTSPAAATSAQRQAAASAQRYIAPLGIAATVAAAAAAQSSGRHGSKGSSGPSSLQLPPQQAPPPPPKRGRSPSTPAKRRSANGATMMPPPPQQAAAVRNSNGARYHTVEESPILGFTKVETRLTQFSLDPSEDSDY